VPSRWATVTGGNRPRWRWQTQDQAGVGSGIGEQDRQRLGRRGMEGIGQVGEISNLGPSGGRREAVGDPAEAVLPAGLGDDGQLVLHAPSMGDDPSSVLPRLSLRPKASAPAHRFHEDRSAASQDCMVNYQVGEGTATGTRARRGPGVGTSWSSTSVRVGSGCLRPCTATRPFAGSG
jgi:hypothetical protein